MLILSDLTDESLFAALLKSTIQHHDSLKHLQACPAQVTATAKHQAAVDEEDVLAQWVVGKSPIDVERLPKLQQPDDIRAGMR